MTSNKKIKTVAFDLGNVLATQDISHLDVRELALLKAYLNRFNLERVSKEALKAGSNNPSLFLKEAEASIDTIYPKIHLMSDEGFKALQMVREMGLQPSIWTNNIWAIYRWFESIGLYDYVNPQHICNSIAMGYGNLNKPDIKFYKLALEQLKKDAKEVLFIDDAIENVAAGLGYGIPSMYFSLSDKRMDNKNLSEIASEAVDKINRSR